MKRAGTGPGGSAARGFDASTLVAPLPPPMRGGCVILSEFSTATSVLNSNLVVNPWNIRMVAREIDKALLMEDHERSFRQWRDYQYAIRNPSATWSRTCISDVVEIRAERAWPGGAPPPQQLSPQPQAPPRAEAAAALSSLQAAAEVERSPVPLLGAAAVARAFARARRRLLVLDYGGTLVTRSHVVGEATGRQARLGFQLDGYAENLPPDVAQALARLAASPETVTYLVSGLRSSAIQSLLVAQTPQLGLAAENGMFVSHPTYGAAAAAAAAAETASAASTAPAASAPAADGGGGGASRLAAGEALAFRLGETFGSPSSTEAEDAKRPGGGGLGGGALASPPTAPARQWVSLSPADAERMAEWQGVKQRAVSIMADYVWRVNGSVVLEYDSLVAWDFRNADPEWAQSQSRFVAQDLEQRALAESPHNVKVTVRKSRVEVTLRAMDKGTVVSELLQRLGREPAGPVDFVLCIGDDTTDEDMFAAVSAWAAADEAARAAGAAAGGAGGAASVVFTATVGKKPATAAGAYVPDVGGVQQLVLALDAAARTAGAAAAAAPQPQ